MYKQSVFPRWRGFNLQGMFSRYDKDGFNRSNGFCEDDFKMISDFGFDFVRIPVSYRIWSAVDNPFEIDERKIAPLDKSIEFGQKYGLHVNLCFHRIPGYCINHDENEIWDIWKDDEALEAAKFQWKSMAKRYADVNTDKLSFNVLNEAESWVTQHRYHTICKQIIKEVREISPDRLFIIDGVQWGDLPPTRLFMMEMENCGYSTRGYCPRGLTHYGLSEEFDKIKPVWPGATQREDWEYFHWSRETLDKFYSMWAALGEIYKVGIHCGEMGVYNKTPHNVALAWLEDVLDSLTERNIGYALWQFRGPFGIMDSDRTDAEYVNCGGHKLDKKMLDILQKY
ncbi:MAG: cellulase family glycosylhydrolase [Clostridia bacterium]|nr:cellulase family glycosylhydrolase [Clostridia bacterium]